MYERAGQYCAKFRLIHNLAAQFIECAPDSFTAREGCFISQTLEVLF